MEIDQQSIIELEKKLKKVINRVEPGFILVAIRNGDQLESQLSIYGIPPHAIGNVILQSGADSVTQMLRMMMPPPPPPEAPAIPL